MRENNCKTAAEYFFLLKNRGNKEYRALSEILTIGETYFFRHRDQLQSFVEYVIPACIKARGSNQQLSILSAGCASGDELGTLAILLNEYFPFLYNWNISLLGIDLNHNFLEKAQRGRYTAWSLRETDEEMRAKYFKKEKNEFLLRDDLREKMKFEQRNLIEKDPEFWYPGRFDVIFCRNCLMYFSSETMRKIITRYRDSLAPHGYLYLGPSETLRGISNDFHLCHTNETFYYRRKTDAELADPKLRQKEFQPLYRLEIAPRKEAEIPAILEDAWVENIGQASERVSKLVREVDARKHTKSIPEEKPKQANDLQEAMNLFRQERFSEAIQALETDSMHADSADALLLHAVILTNRKEFAEADRLCAKILQLDELNAGVHYLRALSCEHEGRLVAAIEQDQTAIYLDPTFSMAHLHLGLMAKRAHDVKTAKSMLLKAENLLATEDSSRILLFGGGFSRETLIKFCKNELRLDKEHA